MLEAELVGAVAAEGDAGDGAVGAPAAGRQVRLDKRRELVDDEALEPRRRRVVPLLVAALCVPGVPVGVVAVHSRLRAVAAGKGLTAWRYEDDAEGLGRCHPRARVGVSPRCGFEAGRRLLGLRLDPGRRRRSRTV